ncbi:UDP-glucose/GDP-mannose dehydrogenase family protein [soil metagenome]
MRISVIGCGYLGAVHAASMASLGHTVVGIDVDADRVALLASGRAPFYEPEFEHILTTALNSGLLTFSTEFADAADAEVHFVAVGTPQTAGSNAADMRYVDAAIQALLPHLAPGSLVAGKSTVPVGTAARLDAVVSAARPQAQLAWNPEFLREGFAVADTLTPDRFVYGVRGGDDGARATAILDEVYATALGTGTPRLVTDFATAELVKVSANAFLATKISFINAMSEIAEATGADVTALADAIGHDARIGRRFLNAGVGFGGGCLPKDIRAFQARADELGVGESLAFLADVDATNLRQRERVVRLATQAVGGDLQGRRIAILGLAFKPNSDDVRDSPALDVAARLRAAGATVVATDPGAIDNARRLNGDLDYVADVETAITGADAVLLLTEWDHYRQLDPVAIQALPRTAVLVDGRNSVSSQQWRDAGWAYVGMGRP